MTSKIDITEFRHRLKENTKIGSPQLQVNLGIFSLFFWNSKYFFGNFDESSFRLIKNYNFSSSFYILKGNYQNINNKLKLNYIVEPFSKFGIIWIKFFPFIALIGFNYFFFFNFKNIPKEAFILFNLFIFYIILHSRWRLKTEKKKLEQKFIELFEINE